MCHSSMHKCTAIQHAISEGRRNLWILDKHTFGHMTARTPRRAFFRNGLSLASPAIDYAYIQHNKMSSTFSIQKEKFVR